MFARCLQHEIDHINGVLFIDHLSKLKRDRIIKKFSKAAKKKVEAYPVLAALLVMAGTIGSDGCARSALSLAALSGLS